jgi:hypothetical protein
MSIGQFFDDVDKGISDAEAFAARILPPLEELFGAANPFAAGLAALFTSLQQDCARVKILVAGVEQSLVLTDTVYQQVVSYVGETVKLMKGSSVVPIVEYLLQTGIPLLLTVVDPGSKPLVTLAEATLSKLVPILFSAL